MGLQRLECITQEQKFLLEVVKRKGKEEEREGKGRGGKKGRREKGEGRKRGGRQADNFSVKVRCPELLVGARN